MTFDNTFNKLQVITYLISYYKRIVKLVASNSFLRLADLGTKYILVKILNFLFKCKCISCARKEDWNNGFQILSIFHVKSNDLTEISVNYVPTVVIYLHCLCGYTEYPCRQCVGLAFWGFRVPVPLAAASFVICSPLRGTACEECRVTTSQLELPSLTPLSVAGCGRLQLGAANWLLNWP